MYVWLALTNFTFTLANPEGTKLDEVIRISRIVTCVMRQLCGKVFLFLLRYFFNHENSQFVCRFFWLIKKKIN